MNLKLLVLIFLSLNLGFSQEKRKAIFVRMIVPDSITVLSASWTVDKILTIADPKCRHEWQTISEQIQYAEQPDSLRQIYNPNGERMIEIICLKCRGNEIRYEHITATKQLNPIRRKVK